HRRATAGFAIAKTEVTLGDWLAYVDAQPEATRQALLPDVEPKIGGGIKLARAADGWKLTLQPIQRASPGGWNEPIRYAGRTRRAEQDWHKLPVTGINALDAEAYVKWLAQTGRVPGVRLCNELEWERAARGPDGRESPSNKSL